MAFLRLCCVCSIFLSVSPFVKQLSGQHTLPPFLDYELCLDEGKHLLCSHAARFNKEYSAHLSSHKLLRTVQRPYNVVRYSLFMDWTNPLSSATDVGNSRMFWGANTITLVIDSANLRHIVLNAALLSIDSVAVNGSKLNAPIPANAETQEFAIPLANSPAIGDTMSVVVYYRHISTVNSSSPFQTGGFYLLNKGTRDLAPAPNSASAPLPERLAYTISEPINARTWMPCNDSPADKALVEIAVRVPEGFSVASNGKLTEVIRNAQSRTTTFIWKHQHPIAPYLIHVAASVFRQFSDYYSRVSNPSDMVEMMYYVWEEDYQTTIADGTNFHARQMFSMDANILRTLSQLWGEYPFEKYGAVTLHPFALGGMEHQTMVSYTRNALKKRSLPYAQDSLSFFGQYQVEAHEAAHHWFGNKVTCATWYDIWLNEGGASYGEALWMEAQMGKRGYDEQMRGFKTLSLITGVIRPIYDLNIAASSNAPNPSSIFFPIVYSKAAFVHHMLRRMLGDADYFGIVRTFLDAFAYRAATTQDFIAVCKAVVPNPPISFDTFFRQWIYQAGHPVYHVSWTSQAAPNGAGIDVNVAIRQTQSTFLPKQPGVEIPDVFEMPLTLAFIASDGRREMRRIINTMIDQREAFTLPFAPARIVVDEQDDVLHAEDDSPTSVQSFSDNDAATALTVRAYPYPFSEETTLEYSLPETSSVEIRISDVLGREVFRLNEGTKPEGTHFIRLLGHDFPARGTYICIFRTSTGKTARSILVRR